MPRSFPHDYLARIGNQLSREVESPLEDVESTPAQRCYGDSRNLRIIPFPSGLIIGDQKASAPAGRNPFDDGDAAHDLADGLKRLHTDRSSRLNGEVLARAISVENDHRPFKNTLPNAHLLVEQGKQGSLKDNRSASRKAFPPDFSSMMIPLKTKEGPKCQEIEAFLYETFRFRDFCAMVTICALYESRSSSRGIKTTAVAATITATKKMQTDTLMKNLLVMN
jgi:hypothetical protein